VGLPTCSGSSPCVPRPTPSRSTSNLSGVSAVSAGASHTCALLSLGTIHCWGLNTSGQLGTGTTANLSYVSTSATGVTTATALTAGGTHSAALTSSATRTATINVWGANASSQIGDGATTNRTSAKPAGP